MAQGDQIDPHILQGKKSPNCRSQCHWPRQAPPPQSAWHLWKSTLLAQFCHPHSTSQAHTSLDLGNFLYRWADPSQRHHCWLALWDPAADHLFTQGSDKQWRLWTRIPTRHRTKHYLLSDSPCPLASIPLSSCCATIRQLSSSPIRLISADPAQPPPTHLPLVTTNLEHPRTLHPPPPTSSQHIDQRWPDQHLTISSQTSTEKCRPEWL